jgi:hypothetical protein
VFPSIRVGEPRKLDRGERASGEMHSDFCAPDSMTSVVPMNAVELNIQAETLPSKNYRHPLSNQRFSHPYEKQASG